jgi:hypothetical protein
MMTKEKMLSIWTLSGAVLLCNGVLLEGVGLWRLVGGVPSTKAMAWTHADVWWPAVIILGGALLLWAGHRENHPKH